MFAPLAALLVGIAVLVIILSKSFVKVPRDFNFVVDTMGRFDRVLEPGVHVVIPFLSRIRAKVPLLDQLLDVRAAPVALSDGSAGTIEGTLRYTVQDTARAFTMVADHRMALATLATTSWQKALAAAPPAQALAAAQGAAEPIREGAREWGIEVLNAVPLLNLDEGPTQAADAPAQTNQPSD